MSQPVDAPTDFPTREDAAWLVFGLFVFSGATGLLGLAMLLSGSRASLPTMLPLVILLIFSAGVLELALRRLQANSTGKRLPPWPLGMVSFRTISKALSPSTVSDAARRIGVTGWAVATCLYLVLLADLIILVIITG